MGARVPVADRLEILDLYAVQSQAIDGGDAVGWAGTFTPDGTFESPTFRRTARGRDALEIFARESNDAALARGEQLRHWLGMLAMEGAGESVSVKGYLLIVATSVRGSRIERSLRVEDKLSRHGGRWLLERRSVFRDDAGLPAT